MAPEFPPVLVIATLRFDGPRLRARLEYIESPDLSNPLRVRWSVETQPMNYAPVGGGVAFVNGESIISVPISEDAAPVNLGDGRYLWKEGIQIGEPRVMFVLILPPGHTLDDPWPFPTGTKVFGQCLALYWMLNKYDDQHLSVEWTLRPLAGDLDAEHLSLNRRFLTSKRPGSTIVKVDDPTQPAARPVEDPASPTKPLAFVAMPMNPNDDASVEVLEAIKAAAHRCDIRAERVDEQHSNERISDRMLKAIADATYVVADLTHGRPNVYYEAGYAHGQGKTPIYIAAHGTKLEFDLQDYPVIFFDKPRDLRDKLEARLKGLATARERR